MDGTDIHVDVFIPVHISHLFFRNVTSYANQKQTYNTLGANMQFNARTDFQNRCRISRQPYVLDRAIRRFVHVPVLNAINVGDMLPSFELISDEGRLIFSEVSAWSTALQCEVVWGSCHAIVRLRLNVHMLPILNLLQDIVSDSGAIIFIYPKANTSGCTTQVRMVL